LRILYHHRTAALDGMAVHIERLVSELRARGHEVCVVGPEAGGAGQRDGRLEQLADRLRAILPPAAFEVLELVYNIPAYRRLARAADRFRPDVLYERNNLFLLAGLWLKRRRALPMLLEVNAPLAQERAQFGTLALKRLARRTQDKVWRGADMVLPVTHVLARMVAEARGPRGIHVICNGGDPGKSPDMAAAAAVRAQLGLENKVVLGFVGFVRPWHGLEWAIHALARLPDRVHLLVVGDGPAQESLEQEAVSLGVAGRVHFAGRLPHDRVPAYVQNFDVALQTRAVGYASPLKLFEYMTMARAIIAPDQPNLREVLTADVDALLFDPRDEESFFQALLRLSGDAALRARLGAAARNTIISRGLTWAENARRVEALALALCSGREGAPLAVQDRGPAVHQEE
jgi:glycosyltransferase involved in cell wall biosynthesis